MEEHRLRLFENRVLGRIFGPNILLFASTSKFYVLH
jgi:hypothetical protein